jgi:hypothetical protein
LGAIGQLSIIAAFIAATGSARSGATSSRETLMRFSHSILALPIVAAAAMAGCASGKPVEPKAVHENVFLGSEPVYAVLKGRSDGQWTFSQVTRSSDEPEEGYLVRLNDLSPAFDIRRAECEPRPYRENDRCNPINPFRDRDMGVVGKIVDTGISAGTGGKISGMSRSYATEFDHLAFNAAVDQALLLSGLDDNRKALIDGLDRIGRVAATQEKEVEELRAQMLRQYELDKKENIKIDAQVTGLVQYYSNDLIPSEFIEVETDVNLPATSPRADTTATEILPCDAARCIDQLESVTTSLQRQHEQQLAGLRAELQRQTDAYVVDCGTTSHAGYHFRLHCPETLERNAEGVILLPVEIEILSRDFEQLFPEFAADNGEIAATVSEGRLMLGNRTGDYIDVQSVSVYYNSHINTTADRGTRFDLAPYQTAAISVGEFVSPEIDIESRHTNMTPDKASRSTFSFGLAVKYSLRNRDAIETLYGAGDFNVQCAIESRIRPGSCRHELNTQGDEAVEESVSSLDPR